MILCIYNILLIPILGNVATYEILGLFPFPGQSHYIMFEALMKELATRGHNVDVLSHFPQEKPLHRFRDLSLKGTMSIFQNSVTATSLQNQFRHRIGITKLLIETVGSNLCEVILSTAVVKQLKHTNKKYDLIITETCGTDCMLGFAHHFKAPVISMTSSVTLPWANDRFGNPDNPSYIPTYLASFMERMSFYQKVDNTITLLLSKFWYSIAQRKTTTICRKFFGEDMPHLQELASNTSLHLVNSHYSLNGARPNVPNVVEVGGLHISRPKPIPKSLHLLFNGTASKEYKGVIYFSMGSTVVTESWHEEKLLALFDAFSELPYQVLWKANRINLPNNISRIPANIHFEPWIPQLDVLCHSSVKLFITHGGIMGVQEAVYCGVPCLGIPLFADQTLNLKGIEARGLALLIDYDDINKQVVLDTARKLLSNPRYKSNANSASVQFRDRPISPLDLAVYWVEYVIKHKGARHLRSLGADLSWYEYHLLDVVVVMIIVVLITFYIVYAMILLFLNLIRGGSTPQKEKLQ